MIFPVCLVSSHAIKETFFSIDKALKETSQLENNLNFFSASKGSSMLDQFQQQIDQNKKQIDNWREELKKLRDAYRQK